MKGPKVQAVRTIVAVLSPSPLHVEVVSRAVGVWIEDEVYCFSNCFSFQFLTPLVKSIPVGISFVSL